MSRRKRGGQPGNQNARKHGLYSLVATPAQRKAVSKAAKINTLDQEIALLRVKIKSALKNTPDNISSVSNAAALLGRLVKIQQEHPELRRLSPAPDMNGKTRRSTNKGIQAPSQNNLRSNEPV